MKALIVASQRSGSTFLAKCLNSHSQIRCVYAELLLAFDWKDHLTLMWRAGDRLEQYLTEGAIPPKVRDAFRTRKPAWASWEELEGSELAPVMMTKIMYNQLLTSPSLDRYIMANTDIRVIHLRRDNLLKQHVSNVLNRQSAQHSRLSHTTQPVPPVAAHINARKAVLHMRVTRALQNWYVRRLSAHYSVELLYETMIEAGGLSDAASKAVFELLDVPPEPLGADLVKVNPDSLRDIVTNYDDLARALTGTEFEKYLE
jgi:hypothetical protein